MKKQITISVPGDQAEALACFLHKKDTTIEQEMEYALMRLYEKHVPPTVRDFLETKAQRESQPPPRREYAGLAPGAARGGGSGPGVGMVSGRGGYPAFLGPLWAGFGTRRAGAKRPIKKQEKSRGSRAFPRQVYLARQRRSF